MHFDYFTYIFNYFRLISFNICRGVGKINQMIRFESLRKSTVVTYNMTLNFDMYISFEISNLMRCLKLLGILRRGIVRCFSRVVTLITRNAELLEA